jgi:hypothetical protein
MFGVAEPKLHPFAYSNSVNIAVAGLHHAHVPMRWPLVRWVECRLLLKREHAGAQAVLDISMYCISLYSQEHRA